MQSNNVDEVTAEVVVPKDPTSADLPTITARTRQSSGSTMASRLRKRGATPAILFSLPGNTSKLLQLDSKDIQKRLDKTSRRRFMCRVHNVVVLSEEDGSSETYRVLPRLVHMNAVTDAVENVTFMHLPPERRVKLDVPLQTVGEDVCPGIKRGGWAHLVTRTVPLTCPGDGILPHVEIDVSLMDAGHKLVMGQLAQMLPPGVTTNSPDPKRPVCIISGSRKD